MKLVALALLAFHAPPDISSPNPRPGDLSGVWCWTQPAEGEDIPKSTLRLALAVDGHHIHGIYCEISNSGGHIDCAEEGDNVEGAVSPSGRTATLTITNKDNFKFPATLSLQEPGLVELAEGPEPVTKRALRKEREVPVDRGACVITASVEQAHFFTAPNENSRTKSYILRDEAALARGWSAAKDFLLVTYIGSNRARRTEWIQCRDFDACPVDTSFYRGMPDPACVGSLKIIE